MNPEIELIKYKNEQYQLKMFLKVFILVTIILFTCFIFSCKAKAEEVNLDIIRQIESSGNPLAYNSASGACGAYQITKPCLEDYNQHHKGSELSRNALFSEEQGRKVALWYFGQIKRYLRHYGLKPTLENQLFAYNAGIGRVVKGIMPEETENYIAKYKRLSKEV